MNNCLKCGEPTERKKYCSRRCGQLHNAMLHKKPKPRPVDNCMACGSSLEGKQWSAMHCSTDCRKFNTISNTKPKREPKASVKKGPTERACAFCGEPFIHTGPKRYCGNECQKANQKREFERRSVDPEWRAKRNEWKRKYKKRPEVKAKENEFAREYVKRPEVRKKMLDYNRRQRKTPKGKVRQAAKEAVDRIFKGYGKDTKTAELIGCSWDEVVKHIESQFLPGMSWENHGLYGWHIDHIIPLASAEGDMELGKMLMHYTNLQPLWAKDNLEKSDQW